MPKLSFTTDEGEELKFGLDVEKVTIGRSEENLIVITDASLSGLHCELLEENGNYRILDLDSTNGTKVNGASIKESLLQDGDAVQLGNLQGAYSSEVARSDAATEELDPTPAGSPAEAGSGISGGADADVDPWAEDPAPAASSNPNVTSAGQAGFGKAKKKKDPLSGVLVTLAVISLLACAVAAFLASQMQA